MIDYRIGDRQLSKLERMALDEVYRLMREDAHRRNVWWRRLARWIGRRFA